jgi:hypothetical protein
LRENCFYKAVKTQSNFEKIVISERANVKNSKWCTIIWRNVGNVVFPENVEMSYEK